jgi:hypothetical protein
MAQTVVIGATSRSTAGSRICPPAGFSRQDLERCTLPTAASTPISWALSRAGQEALPAHGQMRWTGMPSEAPATVSHRWRKTQRGVGFLMPSAGQPHRRLLLQRRIRFDSSIALKCWQIRTQRSGEILWWLARPTRDERCERRCRRGSLLSLDRVMRMLAEVEADLGAMLLGAHLGAGFSLSGKSSSRAPGPLSARFPQLTATVGAREEHSPTRTF